MNRDHLPSAVVGLSNWAFYMPLAIESSLMCKNRKMQVTAVRVDTCFTWGGSLCEMQYCAFCITQSFPSQTKWQFVPRCTQDAVPLQLALWVWRRSCNIFLKLMQGLGQMDGCLSMFCYPLQAECIKFSCGVLLISLFLSQHADTWVLLLNLHQVWPSILHEKAKLSRRWIAVASLLSGLLRLGYSPTSFLRRSFLCHLFSEWRRPCILQKQSREPKLVTSWVMHPGNAFLEARAAQAGGEERGLPVEQGAAPSLRSWCPGRWYPAASHATTAKRAASVLHLKIPSSWGK